MKFRFVIYLLLLLGCSSCQHQQETIAVRMTGNQFFFPVTIGDTTLYLLWDTGATSMILSEKIARKLKINSNGTAPIPIAAFSQHIDPNLSLFDGDTILYLSESNPISFNIGGHQVKAQFILDKGGRNDGIIGNEVLSQFFYLVNFSDTTLCLSDRPIPLTDYAITDSIIVPYTIGQFCAFLCKTTLNSDSVVLKFDSGMEGGTTMNWHPMKISLPHDVVLTAKDSTDRISQIGRSLKNKKATLTMDFNGNEAEIFCTDSIRVASYLISSYIPYLVGSNRSNYMDGFLSMDFALRFDLFYHDKASQAIKFYKLAGVESKTKEIPLNEFFDAALEFTKKSSKMK